MELKIKTFAELTAEELYKIYRLRVAVFVVEQNCVYQDVDEFDPQAIHVWLEENGELQAYLRVLPAHTVFDEVTFGRVIAVKRRCGLGSRIVEEGIRVAEERFDAQKIVIEAQTYARKLYENFGFEQISDEFLEDGIPHIKMRRVRVGA